jgi:hypothetical protein
VQLGGGGLAQHGQNQFNVGHVVAQVLARQGFHLNDEPPFVVVQSAANLAALKQGHARFGMAVTVCHGSSLPEKA